MKKLGALILLTSTIATAGVNPPVIWGPNQTARILPTNGIDTPTGKNLTLQAAGTTAITATTGGNVGIGTAGPTHKLQVAMPSSGNGVNFRYTGGTNNPGLWFGVDEASRVSTIMASGSTSGILALATDNAERMRIDSSGNAIFKGGTLQLSNDNGYVQFIRPSGSTYGYMGTGSNVVSGALVTDFGIRAESNMVFSSGGATERMRIDSSGNVLVGSTSNANGARMYALAGSAQHAATFSSPNKDYAPIEVVNSGGTGADVRVLQVFRTAAGGSNVGSITYNGTSTTYGTSSDYRLKENVQPMSGGLDKVSKLKPCTYNFKSNGLKSEGFIAHELQELIPQAVVGQKDAVAEDGSIIPQQVDYSKIVVHLVSAIQELKAELDAYKATHP